MAEIIKRTEQVNALKEIQDQLDIIGRINAIVGKNGYFISVRGEDGAIRGRNYGVAVDEKLAGKVDALLHTQRERMVKAVKQKAEKFEIALDEADESILAGYAPEEKRAGRKTAND